MNVRKAEMADVSAAAFMAAQLWPDTPAEEHAATLREVIGSPGGAVFFAENNGNPVGFAQCQLRHDYVEGTDTSPVGYLEGMYVKEAFRKHGYASQLMRACEDWARAEGCMEFASDCELGNEESLAFHLKLGFKEANRIICFAKSL